MVQEEETGLWMHPSEVDKPTNRPYRDPIYDDVTLDPALPFRYKGEHFFNPYDFAGFTLHMSQGDLELDYSRHAQHPERTIMAFYGVNHDLTAQAASSLDYASNLIYKDVLGLNQHTAVFRTAGVRGAANLTLYILVPEQRRDIQEFNIGRPNGYKLEQKQILTRVPGTVAALGISFKMFKSPVLIASKLFGLENAQDYYVGV